MTHERVEELYDAFLSAAFEGSGELDAEAWTIDVGPTISVRFSNARTLVGRPWVSDLGLGAALRREERPVVRKSRLSLA